MGFRELLGLSFLIFLFLINLASSYSIHKTLPSETDDKRIYGIKIEGGSSHGGSHGSNSHGNGGTGGSRSPNTPGGAAVIPVYTAGAANNRNRQLHHAAAYCNLNKIKFSTTLVYPLSLLIFLM